MENEYKIVTAGGPNALEGRVKSAMEAGFRPIGGVSVSSHVEERARDGYESTEFTYAQAMIYSVNAKVEHASLPTTNNTGE